MDRLVKLSLVSVLFFIYPVFAGGDNSNDGESNLVRIVEGQNGAITVHPGEVSYVTIWYSPRLDPSSLSVTIDGKELTDRLSPRANSVERLPIYPRDIVSDGRLVIAAESATNKRSQALVHDVERESKIYTVRTTKANVVLEQKIERHSVATSEELDVYAREYGISPARNGNKDDEKK